MIPSFPRFTRGLLAAGTCATLLTGTLRANPVPANLGNGLDKLVASHLALAAARTAGNGLPEGVVKVDGRKYADARAATVGAQSTVDDQARVLVRVTLSGAATFRQTRLGMKAAAASLSITATDRTYRGVGVMNAYVSLDDVPALAQVPGVAAVILELKPHVRRSHRLEDAALASLAGTNAVDGEVFTKLGTAFDQGVIQHRVDQINKLYNPSATLDYEGAGMQIACMSNSFNAHTAAPASTDVTNFDLPGASNNPVNTTPVYVFQDDLSSAGTANESDDEGRGMCQIAYKMAPKAAIAFATADNGEVSFANNIRGLAGIAGYTNSGQTFAADTICDDVGYSDEPFFEDGIIALGVDDASAAGVAYFSSAGNAFDVNSYDAFLHFVPYTSGTTAANCPALVNTNINLANVPANLYAGGFHNFNPGGAQDVAQTVNDPNGSSTPTELQWNEPFDQSTQPNNKTAIWTQSGDYTSTADNAYTYTITPSLTAGVTYELDEVANGDGFDGAITITDPDGTVLVPRQDDAIDETVRFKAPVTGTGYTVTVGHFMTTTGAFTLTLYSTTGYSGNLVSTQISLLVFDMEGNYLPDSSLTTNALATNEPLQLGATPAAMGETQVQYVIARANVSTAANAATRVRYLIDGDGAAGLGPAEYFTYNTPTTGGHNSAASCNGCAAESVFRPSLPEVFTSPGPVTIYFDKNGNQLATPEIRLQPHIAAADGENVSSNMNDYFAQDSPSDPDTDGNFFGTSAAGPHAAAIGALVLEAHGGRHSLTPAQMTSLLERSTFPHDLDPNAASGSTKVTGGSGGKVTVTINSDGSTNAGVGENDPNAFAVNYIGSSSVTSIVFNPAADPTKGGNVSGGNNGVTYTEGAVGGSATYFENSLPGACFLPNIKAFTLGTTTVTGATAAFTNVSGTSTQFYTMTVTIPAGELTGGQVLRFGVGRGTARLSNTGSTGTVRSPAQGGAYYSADIFGGGVTLPEGTAVTAGMTFTGTTADGGTFTGTIRNNVGAGYSPLDGFGFVNAQTAVSQTVQ